MQSHLMMIQDSNYNYRTDDPLGSLLNLSSMCAWIFNSDHLQSTKFYTGVKKIPPFVSTDKVLTGIYSFAFEVPPFSDPDFVRTYMHIAFQS